MTRLANATDETPQPGELPDIEFRLIATPMTALTRMAETARGLGLTPLVLGDALEGESREMGTVMAGIARSIRAHGQPLSPPAVVLSGGETTVTIGRGPAGHGGRNTEFLLALAVALGGAANVWAIAGDTDGLDGMDDIAGAIATPDTLARARAKGLDPRAMLAGHDSHTLFDALGDAVRTGPTLTNVNDVRAILIA
jgi:hydroxypyruvate reductase